MTRLPSSVIPQSKATPNAIINGCIFVYKEVNPKFQYVFTVPLDQIDLNSLQNSTASYYQEPIIVLSSTDMVIDEVYISAPYRLKITRLVIVLCRVVKSKNVWRYLSLNSPMIAGRLLM